MKNRIISIAVPLLFCTTLSIAKERDPAHVGISYYGYAALGVADLLIQKVPLQSAIEDQKIPEYMRRLLAQVSAMKEFAVRNDLKATKSFRDFVYVPSGVVTWAVSASNPLKLQPFVWKFPIVGSFTYIGWFDSAQAYTYAESLRTNNQDVSVSRMAAFSFLRRLPDLIYSSMLSEGPEGLGKLTETVLHESVHATLYVKDQSTFNESLGEFVAQRLTPIFLAEHRGKDSEELKAYLAVRQKVESKNKKFREAYTQLQSVFSSTQPDTSKIAEKNQILQNLSKATGVQNINNSTLTQFKTYGSNQTEFEALFRRCGRNWNRFWNETRDIANESFSKPHMDNLASILTNARKHCRTG